MLRSGSIAWIRHYQARYELQSTSFLFYNLNMADSHPSTSELSLNFSPKQRTKVKRIKSFQYPIKLELDSVFDKLLHRIHHVNQEHKAHPERNAKYSLDKPSKMSEGKTNKDNNEQQQRDSFKAMRIAKPRKLFGKTQQITLCNFVLGTMIGSGTFGDVFLCKERATGTCYALKKILKSTIKSYKLQSQLANEIRIHGSLDHPNIVKFYGCFDDDYHVFLLMQYANEGVLLKQLKRGQKFTARILESVIGAVAHLQLKNIIHRDIKPENIVMLGGVPKLCDFGWAAICNSTRRTFCGTLDYVSPEVLENKQYDESIDVWSLGVLCYQLLTGEPPFKHKDKLTKMSLIKNASTSLKIPPWLSEEAKDFIKRTLEKDPDRRLRIEEASNHPLIKKHQHRRK